MAYDENQSRVSLDADSSIGIRTGVPGLPGSKDPNGGKQFCFVKITDVHTAGLAKDPTSDHSIGVLQNKPQHTGEASSITTGGITLAKAGSDVTTNNISAGAPVTYDSDGKCVDQANATSGSEIVGYAIEETSTEDELFAVLLK